MNGSFMKAISLWQPWGSLWVIGVKGNETRHWATHYRGPLLVHAAKTICTGISPELAEICEANFGARWAAELPRGALIGVVDLISCRPTELCHVDAEEHACGNYTPGRFAWGAQNAYQFCRPIPYRGRQGLFDVPAELVAPLLAGSSIAAPANDQRSLL